MHEVGGVLLNTPLALTGLLGVIGKANPNLQSVTPIDSTRDCTADDE